MTDQRSPWALPLVAFIILVSVVLVGTILALVFAGCSASGGSGDRPVQNNSVYDLTEKSITISDGRRITCIVFEDGDAGGISCDWAGAEGTE